MNLALPVEFLLVVIFLGQAGFHLLESFIVHFGRIDVAAHDLGAEQFWPCWTPTSTAVLEWSELSTGI